MSSLERELRVGRRLKLSLETCVHCRGPYSLGPSAPRRGESAMVRDGE
ncbi:MAG: hypothetical protein K0S65_2791, partial [Labilithrix sp.]|nr:hypothetical protein [Labilithrix sp.]